MHQNIDNAFNEIDAAVFSGDDFIDDDNRDNFRKMMSRWEKELASFDKLSARLRFSEDGTLLDENGNRSIFDDVDE